MSLIFDTWMWVGLGAAIVLSILLFFTDYLRYDQTKSRWRDPQWLAWMGVIIYMFHNAEEYGVDFTGTHLSFVHLMRGMFGDVISDWAFLGCNLPLIWGVGPLIAYLCRKKDRKGMSTAMAIFALFNGVSHLGQSLLIGYNPGLITGVVIFLPFALWVIYNIYEKKRLPWKHLGLTFFAALLYHALLIGGCQLAVHGILLGVPQGIYMTLDALIFLWMIDAINKSRLGEWKN